jgi:hypothetical protein
MPNRDTADEEELPVALGDRDRILPKETKRPGGENRRRVLH